MGRRCICVEVNCGDIRERYHFYTDNLIPGGANVMIEVAKQALAELTKSLLKKGFFNRGLDRTSSIFPITEQLNLSI